MEFIGKTCVLTFVNWMLDNFSIYKKGKIWMLVNICQFYGIINNSVHLVIRFGFPSGKGGWAAPRLKDAALSDDKLRESYFEVHDISCEDKDNIVVHINCKSVIDPSALYYIASYPG